MNLGSSSFFVVNCMHAECLTRGSTDSNDTSINRGLYWVFVFIITPGLDYLPLGALMRDETVLGTDGSSTSIAVVDGHSDLGTTGVLAVVSRFELAHRTRDRSTHQLSSRSVDTDDQKMVTESSARRYIDSAHNGIGKTICVLKNITRRVSSSFFGYPNVSEIPPIF